MDLSLATSLLVAASAVGGAAGVPFASDCGRQFAKAVTSVEGGERVIYMEAANEARDIQSERVLVQALRDSADYFLRFGRIDLDHATMSQCIRDMQLDPTNPYAREIGRPLAVKFGETEKGPTVFVKAGIFSAKTKGNTFTKAADWFWDSLQTAPPPLWYPSVAGTVYEEAPTVDADRRRTNVLRRLRWHSIGLSRTPVNSTLGPLSTTPLREMAKALSGALALSAIAVPALVAVDGANGGLTQASVLSMLEHMAAPGASAESVSAHSVSLGITREGLSALLMAMAAQGLEVS